MVLAAVALVALAPLLLAVAIAVKLDSSGPLLFGAIMQQIRLLHSPRGIFPLRFQGREVEPAVLSSVMSFFVILPSLDGRIASWSSIDKNAFIGT